jgi:uncharacterized protein (DUF488 family)
VSQVIQLKLPTASAKLQIERKALWNDGRTAEIADFYTVGYAGRKTEEVLASLKNYGVATLVDIRQNPVSMYRPDLSKRNLAELLRSHSIAYAHVPALGVPRDIRAKAIDTGTRDVIWEWYDEHAVEPFLRRNLHFFLNAFEHPVALMCSELDPHECHRHRLSLALERLGLRGFDL